jgi:precorrin-4 methylase
MTTKKTTRKNKSGAGRPHVVLDEGRIGQLAFDGCKDATIAAVMGCAPQTITDNYSKVLVKKRGERRAALHSRQTLQALRGDNTMLIWLGKNELEQTDKQSIEHSGPNGGPMIMIMSRPGK